MSRYKTLPDLLKIRAHEHPGDTAHWILDTDGTWHPISYLEFYRKVTDLSWKLKTLGVKKSQVVAIMATTSHHWESMHHAFLALGGIVVGIDPNENPEQLNAIVQIANIKLLATDNLEYLDKFKDLDQFNTIFAFNAVPLQEPIDKIKLIDITKTATDESNDTPLRDILQPSDIATILFTSGTTGTPKGIAYRHDQFITAIDSILSAYPEFSLQPCHLVCWLPLSNLFQRMVNLCALAGGGEVYFVEQPQKVIQYLPQINPHIFIAVPRFYEKLLQGLEAKLDGQPKIVSRYLRFFLKIGEHDSLLGKAFRQINRRIFKSFTSLFGDNIRYMISGSAPTPIRLLKQFKALGLLVLEGYGLSENIVPIAANRPHDYRFGTVGKVISGNSLMLAEDNELWVKGFGVFHGYLGHSDQDHILNTEGYLATGDYAEIDPEGFIRLIGRKSEVFKTSTGRKIAPAEIEDLLRQEPKVENAVIFGESRKFLIALITTSAPQTNKLAEITSYAQGLAKSLADNVSKLPDYKRPAGFILSFSGLSVAREELTSNLKLRRRNIHKNYEQSINQLYRELENPASEIHYLELITDADIVLVKLPPC